MVSPNPSPHSVKPNEHEHFEDKDFYFPGPQMCPGCKEKRSRRDPPLDITVPMVVGDPLRCTETYIEERRRVLTQQTSGQTRAQMGDQGLSHRLTAGGTVHYCLAHELVRGLITLPDIARRGPTT